MDDAVAPRAPRKAFGVQVGRFQQIETLLTDMEVRLRNMRSMVYRAAWLSMPPTRPSGSTWPS